MTREEWNMLNTALHKAIPEKPINRMHYLLGKNTEGSHCWGCGTLVLKGWSYCPYCGQAIDWEDKK